MYINLVRIEYGRVLLLQGCPTVQAENQHWTALTYAALQGNIAIAKLLLERGANVEGGARLSEEKSTMTPLQVRDYSPNVDCCITVFITCNILTSCYRLLLLPAIWRWSRCYCLMELIPSSLLCSKTPFPIPELPKEVVTGNTNIEFVVQSIVSS